jgi:hypothetical protein
MKLNAVGCPPPKDLFFGSFINIYTLLGIGLPAVSGRNIAYCDP